MSTPDSSRPNGKPLSFGKQVEQLGIADAVGEVYAEMGANATPAILLSRFNLKASRRTVTRWYRQHRGDQQAIEAAKKRREDRKNRKPTVPKGRKPRPTLPALVGRDPRRGGLAYRLWREGIEEPTLKLVEQHGYAGAVLKLRVDREFKTTVDSLRKWVREVDDHRRFLKEEDQRRAKGAGDRESRLLSVDEANNELRTLLTQANLDRAEGHVAILDRCIAVAMEMVEGRRILPDGETYLVPADENGAKVILKAIETVAKVVKVRHEIVPPASETETQEKDPMARMGNALREHQHPHADTRFERDVKRYELESAAVVDAEEVEED